MKDKRLNKAFCTYVALIATDSSSQPRLPQFLLSNGRWLSKRGTAGAATAPNLHLRVAKTAWSTEESMMWILATLKAALSGVDKKVLLVWDTASPHITKNVLLEARRLNFRVVPVPAGLTSLVQPLDTHCFAAMKRRIRERYTQCRSAGDFNPHAFLKLMSDISSKFLCSVRWATAFEQVGILDCPHSHLTRALQDYFPDGKTASFPQPVESRGAAATFAQRPTILVQTLVQRKIGVAVASRHCAGTRPRPPGPLVFVRQVRVSACLCVGSLWEGRCSDLRRGLCVSPLRSGHAYLVVCACHPCAVAMLISWFVHVTLAQFCGVTLGQHGHWSG